MKKVAIIVQRCHESVVGGSEALAWHYATLLKQDYEVDVLSTTAVDAAYWTNVLPEGTEVRDDINIRRFHVDIGYSSFRTELFARLVGDYDKFHLAEGRETAGQRKHLPWSIPLQEEMVRRIGPYSGSLVNYVRDHWSQYRAIIVVTYLYPTAYFSLMEIPKGRALFAPTLHDEEPAYLSVHQHAARRAHSLIWLTEAEQRLGTALWGELPGRVVAMAIDAEPREPAETDEPYILYCGRIDPNKGCATLFEYFSRYKQKHPSSLRLVLTGKADIPVPDHPEIDYRGFVSTEEKFSLMSGAEVYVMPSAKESFSIVALEAMAQRTPVLGNADSAVLKDHIDQSGGGRTYSDYETFAAGLREMTSNGTARQSMGTSAREYVTSRYVTDRVRKSLIEAVESCPESDAPSNNVSYFLTDPPRVSRNGRGAAKAVTSQDLAKSPPLPLPRGWSEANLRRLVSSVRVEDASIEEMRGYVQADFNRFVYTLSLVPEKSGQKILELGANPYFMTTLLGKFRDADLHLANFFDGSQSEGTQRVTVGETGEIVDYDYKQFNIEKDPFPYEDDFFDVVLFCEIIEHLLSDPVHALTEIKRILKPGGVLVLTTPNVARLDNVRRIISGANLYDPYSDHGPYGRHNREYTLQDLFELLSSNGFALGTIFTADAHPGEKLPVSVGAIAPLVQDRSTDLGQYIFCQCTISRESKDVAPARPPGLYRGFSSESVSILDLDQQEMEERRPEAYALTLEDFRQAFETNLANCIWEPHQLYSVFTQYDAEVYLRHKEAFLHKYRCMYTVTRTIQPRKIIEIGTAAGSSADAYLSASPDSEYIGLDMFGHAVLPDGSRWDPYEIADTLLSERGFEKWKLVRCDLRGLFELPEKSDFVVVDGAHDFGNQYADCLLALTAEPTFIFIDDADDENHGKPAIDKFISEDLNDHIDFIFPVSYIGGGLVIKLKVA